MRLEIVHLSKSQVRDRIFSQIRLTKQASQQLAGIEARPSSYYRFSIQVPYCGLRFPPLVTVLICLLHSGARSLNILTQVRWMDGMTAYGKWTWFLGVHDPPRGYSLSLEEYSDYEALITFTAKAFKKTTTRLIGPKNIVTEGLVYEGVFLLCYTTFLIKYRRSHHRLWFFSFSPTTYTADLVLVVLLHTLRTLRTTELRG